MLVKNVPLERWIQLMTGGFTTVNLSWVNKIAVIGYTRLYVYQIAHSYEERNNFLPSSLDETNRSEH